MGTELGLASAFPPPTRLRVGKICGEMFRTSYFSAFSCVHLVNFAGQELCFRNDYAFAVSSFDVTGKAYFVLRFKV